MLELLVERNPQLGPQFFDEIERIVEDGDGITYLDAIMHYIEKHGIEIETVGVLIKQNPKMKMRLMECAEDLNFLKKTPKLDIECE